MAHTPFTGSIPDDRLYCPAHDMWVQEIGDGEFRVGATSFGIFLAGEIIAFTAKPKGASGERGRGMGTVECRKTVLAVHAPLAFVLLEGNEAAEERPRLINTDPYGAGWVARVQASDWASDRAALVDAATYRQHVLRIEPEACFV
ncbi:MAG: glycine cleavage system protein H [Rhodocyclaceae bacterium]|nr:MAG: glycine cleavage system protein H [Rhodocyclaceae bacterium]